MLRALIVRGVRPESPSWRVRVLDLLPTLRERHEIHADILSLPKTARGKFREFRRHRNYDIAWLHRHTLWPLHVQSLRRTARSLVFDYDDPVCFSTRNRWNFSLSRWLKFRATLGRCDGVLAASDRLVELARPLCQRVVYSPLCVEVDGESVAPGRRKPPEPLRLLWLGSRATFRYLEQVKPHLEAVGRACPEVELIAVGHARLALENLKVTNIQWSPESEQEQLGRCHVGIVPLPDNPWTRGKAAIKPLLYMSSGLPFIGSRVGVNLRLHDGNRNGFLADTPEEWVTSVRALLGDEEKRLSMARSGIDYMKQNHGKERLAAITADLFYSLVSGAAAGVTGNSG